MKFKMNGDEWEILEVSQQTMQEYAENENDLYFGETLYFRQQIFLLELDCTTLSRMRKTLYHELTHVYIHEYVTTNGIPLTEEFVCEIAENSHDIIHEIVDNYFEWRNNRDRRENIRTTNKG